MDRVLLAVVALACACGRDPVPPSGATAAPQPAGNPAAPAPPAAPAKAAAPAGEPDWGEPDMAEVAKLFRRRFAEVKRCYEAALARDDGARGKFTLRFTILETGALADVSTTASTFRGREVPACVAEVVRGWRTPFRPAEPVAVEYPLRFTPR